MYKIIDGKKISQKVKDELKNNVLKYKEKFNEDISLAVILVGDNPASKVYVNNKIKACEYVGIKSLSYILPKETSFEELSKLIKELANDKKVNGILVQLPLPKHLNEREVLSLIPKNKDVDGFTSENVGNLFLGEDTCVSCTPLGVLTLLKEENISLTGKNAVVIGRSNIVGKPMAILLLNENCTVTVCHSKTKDLKSITKKADIIVCAVGKPNTLTKDMVKKGVVIIDVGINRTEKGLVGDVDFKNVCKKASYITPVPGGVGPMTIAMLLQNTYTLAIKGK